MSTNITVAIPENILKNSQIDTHEILSELSPETISEIFSAYKLPLTGLKNDQIKIYLNQLHSNKKTFPYLLDAVTSDRHPFTIMLISCKFGMYIPPKQRVGIKSYQFFINNVNYYETTFERSTETIPNIESLILDPNPVKTLMKFRDDEILKTEHYFDRNYNDRRDMIEEFVRNNVAVNGNFDLVTNSRSCYSSNAKTIIYTDPNIKVLYSCYDLLGLFDHGRGKLWRDQYMNSEFNKLALANLREKILKKLAQWKNRDIASGLSVPIELVKILENLDNLLVGESKTTTDAYLGNPSVFS